MGILQFTEELEHPLRLLQAGKQVSKDGRYSAPLLTWGWVICVTLYSAPFLTQSWGYVLHCIMAYQELGVMCYLVFFSFADLELGVMCYIVLKLTGSWVLCVTLYYS